MPTEEAVVELADEERKAERRSVAGVKTEEVDVDLADVEKKAQKPSAAPTVITVNDESENDQETWKEIARAKNEDRTHWFSKLQSLFSQVPTYRYGKLWCLWNNSVPAQGEEGNMTPL